MRRADLRQTLWKRVISALSREFGAQVQVSENAVNTLIFSFLAFLENGKENHKKTKDSFARRTPRILGKERRKAQNRKEFPEKENGKEIQKGKEKKIWE